MAYRILCWFLRIVTRVFFRQIEVVGLEHVPATGPVLFAGNHPNSLIDPILIITTCGRKVHFAAKDSLFKGRLMRAVLRGLGAVPIKRRDDHDGTTAAASKPGAAPVDNDAAFDAMFDVLGAGGAIGMFPEGLSHDEAQLSRLKTGAARLALGGAQRTQQAIAIVPCGLTFIHPKRFRSRVLVQFGAPVVIESARPNNPDEVRVATTEIETALRRLTVNAPDWDTVRALDVVRRLYQPQEISIEERVELARRFNTYYGAVAEDPRVIALMTRVRAYQDKLDELGITDRELARDLSKLEVSARVLRHLVLVAFWLPLTAPGVPLNLLPLAFARFASDKLTPRKDVVATTKLLIGMLIVLLAYSVTVSVFWWKLGFWVAVVVAIILPLSGWATLRVLDRLRLVRRGLGVLFRRLRFRREVRALRHERDELVEDVIRVVTAVKPAGLQALFPADHPDRVEESSRARRDADLDAELDKDAAERKPANVSNTSVVLADSRLLSLWEGGPPFELDPVTLATRGLEDFHGAVDAFSAHPRIDPDSGELFNFGIAYGRRCTLTPYRLLHGQLTKLPAVTLPHPVMNHDFVLTEHYLVFCLGPILVSPLKFLLGLSSFDGSLHWDGGKPTLILLIPRDGGTPRFIETEAFFQFHFANAYEADGAVVLDVARYPNFATIGKALRDYWRSDWPAAGMATLTRLTIDLATGTVASRAFAAGGANEFPKFDPRRAGKPYRYAYIACNPPDRATGLQQQVARVDLESGAVACHDFGPHGYVGEPYYIPTGAGEDDGVVVTQVFDSASAKTAIVALDGRDVGAGPLFIARLKHPVPYGLHGCFQPGRTS